MKLILCCVLLLHSLSSLAYAYYNIQSEGTAENCFSSQLCEQDESKCVYPSDDEAIEDARFKLEAGADIFTCDLLKVISNEKITHSKDLTTTCYKVDIVAEFKCSGYW